MDDSFLEEPERWQFRRWKPAAFASPVLAIGALCNACTWVEIQSGDGHVRIERHLGFVSLELPPDLTSRVVHLTGVGLISMGFETTVGYADATMVTLGNDCRLLIWIDNEDQIANLRDLARDIGDLCVMAKSKFGGMKL